MINLYYCNIENFGDWINPYLVERITGKKCVFAGKRNAELCAVGSVLTNFTRKRFLDIPKNLCAPEINVWSSGFIKKEVEKESFRARKMNFLALRGYKSKQRVENILGKKIDVALGDGGLLFDLLLDKMPEKKYFLGIIPHTSDWDNPIFDKINEKEKSSKIIDLRRPPLEVLKDIASCETIVSTAMHGLIAADSLQIPNKWIEVSDNVVGNGYKFEDYYSVFDKNPKPIVLKNKNEVSSLDFNKLFDDYYMDKGKLESTKKNLYKSLKVFYL